VAALNYRIVRYISTYHATLPIVSSDYFRRRSFIIRMAHDLYVLSYILEPFAHV